MKNGDTASIQLQNDYIVQIGASLYGLINIITRDEYDQFIAKDNQSQDLNNSDFNLGLDERGIGNPGEDAKSRELNRQQLVLRIKFFGGQMYGQVKYFVPDWSFTHTSMFQGQDIETIQKELPQRHFTVGRKVKP